MRPQANDLFSDVGDDTSRQRPVSASRDARATGRRVAQKNRSTNPAPDGGDRSPPRDRQATL